MSARFWSLAPEGLKLRVRLSPNGGCDKIGSVRTLADGTDVLAVKVKAIAEKGRANSALEKLIARAVGVASGQVQVVAGQKNRTKTVKITGDGTKLAVAISNLPHKG